MWYFIEAQGGAAHTRGASGCARQLVRPSKSMAKQGQPGARDLEHVLAQREAQINALLTSRARAKVGALQLAVAHQTTAIAAAREHSLPQEVIDSAEDRLGSLRRGLQACRDDLANRQRREAH